MSMTLMIGGTPSEKVSGRPGVVADLSSTSTRPQSAVESRPYTQYLAATAMSASPGRGPEQADLKIKIGLPNDADAEELDEATLRLRNELLGLDVDRVERPAMGEPPVGARAAEVFVLGGLIVTLARNAATITSVIRNLESWLARDRNRSVTLELDGDRLEVTGISSSEQERLIAAWIARHANLVS